MSGHHIPGTCLGCEKEFVLGDKVYYIACGKLEQGKWKGKTREFRVVFFGGVRKDRRGLCLSCYEIFDKGPLNVAQT